MSDKDRPGLASIMRKSTPMETSDLIEQVRQRPCLWNRNGPEYRMREVKDKAWIEVCRALEPTYDEMTRSERHEFGLVINRKWCNIRDCYKKHLNGSARFSVSGRPYMHAEQLSFLNVLYDSKEQSQTNRKRRHFASDPDETQQEEWLNEVFVEMENTEDGPIPDHSKKIKVEYPRAKEAVEADENIVSVLVNLIEKEEDEDRAFFKSIIPTVKSLPDDDKFTFRIQVMKMLDALIKKRHHTVKRQNSSPDSDTD